MSHDSSNDNSQETTVHRLQPLLSDNKPPIRLGDFIYGVSQALHSMHLRLLSCALAAHSRRHMCLSTDYLITYFGNLIYFWSLLAWPLLAMSLPGVHSGDDSISKGPPQFNGERASFQA